MNEERLAEIKHSFENACGVAYGRLDYSQGYSPGRKFDFDASEDMLELIEEVERLQSGYNRAITQLIRRNTQRNELSKQSLNQAQEIARLRKALEFYADEDNYDEYLPSYTTLNIRVLEDEGNIAREALSHGK